MSRVKLNIDKSILAWAIERSGKDCCAYLEQHPKVKEWMDDLDRPTLKQLERFAKELFVPMGYLFLPTPPVETMPIPLFRRINDKLDINVYDTVNDGVYKAGFATTQDAYEEAVSILFDALDTLEVRLADQRYLIGDTLTEADWRLCTTLVRFDAVYVGHFNCNIRRIVDYPNL